MITPRYILTAGAVKTWPAVNEMPKPKHNETNSNRNLCQKYFLFFFQNGYSNFINVKEEG